LKELREAAKRWRLLLSAVWTRQSLREEFGMDDRGGGGERDDDDDDDEDDDAAAATARRVAALTDDLDGHGGSRKKQKTWIPAFAEVEYV
jgi:xeroderma pigmentosum group C-complementing protein